MPLPYHVAKISRQLLLLNESFEWLYFEGSSTGCKGASLADAVALGREKWKNDFFTLLHCGFRYTLPTRDETGTNAHFRQMAQSYSSPNGRYFDEEVGHMCYVDFAAQEALEIWRKIR